MLFKSAINGFISWLANPLQLPAGIIPFRNHYYAYGLKIAAISSRKLQDNYEGETKNNYLYQGAFAELDEDIGWTDFPLRNYDTQIGRFVQVDPFGQFPSPYIGMGNDPVNLIDPSGGIGIPCPGTSQLAIFFMKAGETIGKGLNAISRLSPWLSLGLNAARIGADIYNQSVHFKIIDRQLAGNLTLEVGIGNNAGTPSYWILYNGTNVNIYQGTYGDESNLFASYAASSGSWHFENSRLRYMKSNSDNEPGGPLPEGEYQINLKPDPRQTAKFDANDKLIAGDGVQLLANKKKGYWFPRWGRFRAKLNPIDIDNPTGRNGFYMHDSYKGESHGCIETVTSMYYFFLFLHDSGVPNIKIKVKYPNGNSSTYGGTDKIPFTVPSNIKGKDMGIDRPYIPIPSKPYKFKL